MGEIQSITITSQHRPCKYEVGEDIIVGGEPTKVIAIHQENNIDEDERWFNTYVRFKDGHELLFDSCSPRLVTNIRRK